MPRRHGRWHERPIRPRARSTSSRRSAPCNIKTVLGAPETRYGCEDAPVPQDAWAALADPFVEGAYATVKGQVRTYVLHGQLLRHLPAPAGSGARRRRGAAHQSLPLPGSGYDVTVLDPSPAMLAKAEQRLDAEPEDVRVASGWSRRPASRPRRRPVGSGSPRCSATASSCTSRDPSRCSTRCAVASNPEAWSRSWRSTPRHWPSVRPWSAAGPTRWPHSTPPARWECSAPTPAATPSKTCRSCCGATGSNRRPGTGSGCSRTGWTCRLDGTDVEAVADVELQASLRDPYRQLSRAVPPRRTQIRGSRHLSATRAP